MGRIQDFVEDLKLDELYLVLKDLETGGIHLKRIVKESIRVKQRELDRRCHSCMNRIDPENIHNYTILIGPDSLKRKASFCGEDCLEYFLKQLKEARKNAG